MNNTDQAQIRLIVDDEQTLYSKFSPEDEFNESVKSYIRSKITNKDSAKEISLTVISQKPLDEERFRTAVANWIRDEKISFKVTEKNTIHRLFGLLIFGSIMILICLFLEKRIDVLKYSLLPIMGSLALSRAASILVLDMPAIRAQRWMLNEMEKRKVITFEYENHGIESV